MKNQSNHCTNTGNSKYNHLESPEEERNHWCTKCNKVQNWTEDEEVRGGEQMSLLDIQVRTQNKKQN